MPLFSSFHYTHFLFSCSLIYHISIDARIPLEVNRVNQVFSSEKSCTWRSAISSNGVISGCSITNRLERHSHPVSSTGYTRVGIQKRKELLIRYTKRYLLLFNHQGPSKFNQKKRELASCRPPQGIYAEMKTSRHVTILVLCVALVAKDTLISAKQNCRTAIICSLCLG